MSPFGPPSRASGRIAADVIASGITHGVGCGRARDGGLVRRAMRAAGVAAGAPGGGAEGGAGMSVPSHLPPCCLAPPEVRVRGLSPWLRKHPTWRHTLWRQGDIEPLIDEPLRRVWD